MLSLNTSIVLTGPVKPEATEAVTCTGEMTGGVVVRSGNDNSPAAGEGGGEIIGSSVPMLEEGDGAGREDEEDAEDNILDEAALGAGNLGRVHRANTHKYTADFFKEKGRVLLGRFIMERVINRD